MRAVTGRLPPLPIPFCEAQDFREFHQNAQSRWDPRDHDQDNAPEVTCQLQWQEDS
jgi:hypothetical protein